MSFENMPVTRFELSLEIAALPIRLIFYGADALMQSRWSEMYQAFCSPNHADAPLVEALVEPGEPFLPFQPPTWRIETSTQLGRVDILSHLEKGWFDLNAGQGFLALRPNGNPENYLRVVYAWRCLAQEALLLHASGVIRNGRGYVFFGHSGSGKTTLARLSSDALILSDDLVILKCEDADDRPTVRVFGVPFRGELPEAPRANASAPLCGLFSLVKDDHHQLEKMERHEAVGRLASCVPFVMSQPQNAQRVLKLCDEITRRVAVQSLHFRRDPAFWSVLDE
jgi:hypothetical protein